MRTRPVPRWVSPLLGGLLALPLACAPPTPYYDDTTGLEGVATEPGALAGVFGLKVFAATLVQVPLLPDELGGGYQWLLLERSYDGEAGVYRQRSRICDGRNLEVHGTAADVPRSTYRAVPPSEQETVTLDHPSGAQTAEGLVQLWGVRDLDNPAGDPFPTSATEAESGSFANKIYDMDGDDAPGYTTFVSGLTNGEAYGILRRRTSYRGVVLSADRVLGLATTEYDSLILGANDDFVKSLMDAQAPPYPDPKESWFEELRLPAGSGCDDVVELEESGTFSRLRPF